MKGSSKLKLLISQGQLHKTLPNESQLGKKLLDILLYKVVVIQMKEEVLYRQLKGNYSETYKDLLQDLSIDQLLIFMWKIIMREEYHLIKIVQDELKNIKSLKKTVSTSRSEENIINKIQTQLNKTNNSSINNSLCNLQLQSILSQSEQSFNDKGNSKDLSYIQRIPAVQQKQQQQSFLQELTKIQMGRQIQEKKKIPSNKLEKSLDPIPKDAAGVLKVRNYLKKVMNFNTEMNQLEQKLKLQLLQSKQTCELIDGVKVKVHFRSYKIPEILTSGDQTIIKGQGRASNIINAKQRANKSILYEIYSRFPHILAELLRIKDK